MGSKILRDLYPEHESIGGHWWILKKTRARVHGRPHKGLGPGPSKLQDPRNSGSKMTLFICCGSQGFSSWFSISVYQLSLLFSLFFPVYFHVGQTRPHLFLCTTEMKPQISVLNSMNVYFSLPSVFYVFGEPFSIFFALVKEYMTPKVITVEEERAKELHAGCFYFILIKKLFS